ncbi:hypothetical protein FRC03_006641 [Tulasnella sp. 419]|nr:hypothetical protein FRC03_006641 [Tulasnella sp. 419]
MGPPLITPSRTGFPRTESIGTDSYTNTSSSALPTPEPPMSPTNARPRPSLHLPMHAPYSTETEDESIPMVSRHGPASSGYFGADSGYGGSNLSSTTYKSHSTTSSSSKHNGENALGSKVKKKSRWMYETITSRSREPPHSGEGSGPAITTPSVFHNTPPHRPKLAPHPRDHSILKAAYEQVFAERFINPNPLSILPYYLTLHLQNVKSLPPIQFHLPGPSTTSKQHPSHSEHHVHGGPNKPSTQSPTTSNPGPSTPISPPPHHTHSAPSSASKPRTRARAASVTTPGSASASLGMSNNRSSLNPSGISRPKYDSASPSASIPPNPLSLPQQRPTITPLVTSQIPKSPSTTSFDESLYSKKSASRSGADSKPPSTAASRSSNIGVPPSPARSSTSRRSSLVNGIPSSSTPPPPVPPLQPLAHRPSISSTGSGAPRSNRSVSGQQIGGSHSDAIKGHGRSNSQEEYISALHLARAFQTIVSCKDEIRRQFMLMEDDMIDELLPKYSHASNADSSSSIWDDAGFSHQQHRSRGRSADEEGPLSGDEVDEFDDDMAEMTRSEMFDFLWRNYELDMKDRISMGNVVHDNIGSCIGSQNVKDPAKAKQSNAWKARIERADWRMENMSLEEKKTGVLGRPPLGVGYGYRKRAESAATTSGQNYEISRMVRWFVAFKEEGPKSTLESDALTEDEDDMAITFAKRTSSDEDVTSTDSESGL